MLLRSLPALSHFDHTILTLHTNPGPLAPAFQQAGITVQPIPSLYHLWRYLYDVKPNLLVTYLQKADLLGRLIGRAAGIESIVCSVRANLWGTPFTPFFILDGLTSPLVSFYHFNSPFTSAQYQRWFNINPKKCTVIPNIAPNVEFRNKPDFATDDITLGCVAGLRHQKGHYYLLKAFADTHSTHPKTKLLIIGDGNQRSALTNQAKRLGIMQSVSFLGQRHDVFELLPTLDIFILPTLYEGMSNAILEAMAAGLPIITTDIPEHRWFLQHKVNALLVKPKDASALRSAINSLLANPHLRTTLAHNAHLKAQQFSPSKILPKINQVYLDQLS